MKKEVIEKIGTLFTQEWVEMQMDSKLEGFTSSAERCLKEQRDYETGKVFFVISFVLGIHLSLYNSAWTGGVVLLVSFGIYLLTKRVLFTGLTSKKISKDWRPIRKNLLKSGVINHAVKILKQDEGREFIPDTIIRNILVRAFDETMRDLLSKLRKAEREGFPAKEIQTLRKIETVKDLAEDLGLEMTFEDP